METRHPDFEKDLGVWFFAAMIYLHVLRRPGAGAPIPMDLA